MRRTIAVLVVVLALGYSLLPPLHFTGALGAHDGAVQAADSGQVDSLRHHGPGPTSTDSSTPLPPTATATSTPTTAPPSPTATATATATSTATAVPPSATATASSPASATTTATAPDGSAPSLLSNGGFDQSGASWAVPWTLSLTAPAVATLAQDTSTFVNGSASAAINVTTAVPTAGWDAQLGQGGLSLTAGAGYTLSFWAKSSASQQVMASVQQTVSPYGGRAKQWYTLTSSWQQYTLSFSAPNTEGNIGVVFNLAAATGTIWLDGVSFTDPAPAASPSATGTGVPPSATATLTSVPPSTTATAAPSTATTSTTPSAPTASQTPAVPTPTNTPPTASTPLVFNPVAIATSAAEVVNPMRGLYKWGGQEQVPVSSYDSYQRFHWRDLETSQGVYNFSAIDAGLADAQARGGKFGFRIMAADSYTGGAAVPDYLISQMPLGFWFTHPVSGKYTYAPDWNSSAFITRAQALVSALAQHYANDPRLGFVDIGLYGDFGEWHVSGYPYNPSPTGATPGTLASEKQLIDMVAAAFPTKFLVMNPDGISADNYAFSTYPKLGIRNDCLGSTNMDDMATRNFWNDAYPYNATINDANTAPVYSGSDSIAFSLTGSWGELQVNATDGTPFDLTPYTTLHFAAQAGQSASNLIVQLDNGSTILGKVSLASYGGQPVHGAWKVYDIPLAGLGVTGVSPHNAVTAIHIQDQTGQSSGITYYIDDIELTNSATHATTLVYGDWYAGPWNDYMRNRWKTAPVITEMCGEQPGSNSANLTLTQAQEYHVSMIGNGNLAPYTWSSFSATEQNTLMQAFKSSGYRLTLNSLTLPAKLGPGGTFTVSSSWTNTGVAPLYERWQVELQLRNSGGSVMWQGPSALDLTTLLPSTTPTTVTDSFQLPAAIAPGAYSVSIAIVDPTGYRKPLALAIQGQQSDGSYPLSPGTVSVGG